MSKQQELLGKAIRIASIFHEGAFDKSGNPYILHCLHVMNTVDTDDIEIKQAAVLHDVLEDTDITEDYLLNEGFSNKVIEILNLVTHKEEDSYHEYIDKICNNLGAVLIKEADLKHNSDITRLKGIRQKDLDRMAKYHRAYLSIQKAKQKLQ